MMGADHMGSISCTPPHPSLKKKTSTAFDSRVQRKSGQNHRLGSPPPENFGPPEALVHQWYTPQHTHTYSLTHSYQTQIHTLALAHTYPDSHTHIPLSGHLGLPSQRVARSVTSSKAALSLCPVWHRVREACRERGIGARWRGWQRCF